MNKKDLDKLLAMGGITADRYADLMRVKLMKKDKQPDEILKNIVLDVLDKRLKAFQSRDSDEYRVNFFFTIPRELVVAGTVGQITDHITRSRNKLSSIIDDAIHEITDRNRGY